MYCVSVRLQAGRYPLRNPPCVGTFQHRVANPLVADPFHRCAAIRRISLALLLLGVCVPAAATLGEEVSSVRVDQTQMEATLEITDAAKFSLHQIRLPSGTVVKEYVSPSGIVFAISWQGPTLPNLRQVLGRYFEQYAAAVRSRNFGPGSLRTEGPGLVVHSGGHMRAFFGRAYLQQMVPRGVLAEEIQ